MNKFIAAPFGNYIKTSKTISVTGSWTVDKRTGRLRQIVKHYVTPNVAGLTKLV